MKKRFACPERARPVVRLIRDAWGKARRCYAGSYARAKVIDDLQRRRGECRRCGSCCRIVYRCPFLEGNTCVIYGIRPEQCRLFPIDERDLASVDGQCGFYFEE